MERIYIICMAIGIGIPLFSIVFGGLLDLLDGSLDGVFDGFNGDLDLDFSVGIGNVFICLIPMSIQSICAGLLFFGGIGLLVFNGSNFLIANMIAGVTGYVAATVIQTFINRLKRIDSSAWHQDDFVSCEAKVTNTIMKGGFGAVSIKKDDGTTVNYPAKALDSDEEIRQDTPVYILKFEKNVAIVKKANYSLEYRELL